MVGSALQHYRAMLSRAVAEGTSCQLKGTLKDETGAVLPGADLTTLTVTLYVKQGGAILNSRDHQDILGVNGGAVDNFGVFTLDLSPADNAIARPQSAIESHVALIEWTYNGGVDAGKFEIEFRVANLKKVPA